MSNKKLNAVWGSSQRINKMFLKGRKKKESRFFPKEDVQTDSQQGTGKESRNELSCDASAGCANSSNNKCWFAVCKSKHLHIYGNSE